MRPDPFTESLRRVPEWMIFGALVVVSIVAYVQYGTDGALYRDDGIYVYSGQQFAQGVPPYVSVLVEKGPLAPMMIGFGVMFGNAVGMNDLLAARLLFLLLSALTVASIYLLARDLVSSRRAGVFSALTFLCFWGFGRYAMAGPRDKTPMVLFQVLAFYCVIRRRWFAAGALASLATLVWQPGGIFALTVVVLAFLASERGERLRSTFLAVAGGLVPLALCVGYYLAKGALPAFIEGFITLTLASGGRGGATPFLLRFTRVISSVGRGYTDAAVFVWLGLGMCTLAYAVRGEGRGWARVGSLLRDPFAPLLVSLPAVVIWSLIDYQDYPDFFILLPYAAVGFGWLLHVVASWLGERLGPRLELGWCCAWVAVFVIGAVVLYRIRSDFFFMFQVIKADEVAAVMGDDDDWTLASFGSPSLNVLLHKRNVTRYLIFNAVIEELIAKGEPGHFRGWIDRLDAQEPDMVYLGAMPISRRSMVVQWLEEKYAQPLPRDENLWVRKSRMAAVDLERIEAQDAVAPKDRRVKWGSVLRDLSKFRRAQRKAAGPHQAPGADPTLETPGE